MKNKNIKQVHACLNFNNFTDNLKDIIMNSKNKTGIKRGNQESK